MRMVEYFRPEADDPLILAKAVIDQAIFEREALRVGLVVHDDDNTEDGQVGWYVLSAEKEYLISFLERLRDCGLPLLNVTVPDDELTFWEAHELNQHFCFDVDHEN